jgi:plasmid stability protein
MEASCHMEVSVPKDGEKYIVRLPGGWREAIKVRAAANRRSMNQEILAALEGVVGAAAGVQFGDQAPAAGSEAAAR